GRGEGAASTPLGAGPCAAPAGRSGGRRTATARPPAGRRPRARRPAGRGIRVRPRHRVTDHGGMPVHPHTTPPIHLAVDSDCPADVVNALFLDRFSTGEQPHAHGVTIDRVRSAATLLPAGARLLRAVRERTGPPPWPRATAGRCWSPAGSAAPTSPSPRPPPNSPRRSSARRPTARRTSRRPSRTTSPWVSGTPPPPAARTAP